jgi:hypothetical protein
MGTATGRKPPAFSIGNRCSIQLSYGDVAADIAAGTAHCVGPRTFHICYRLGSRESSAVVIESPPNLEDQWSPSAPWPRRRAVALLARFRKLFPGVTYDLYWETDTVNAQAFVLNDRKCVRLYGGLARHRRLSFAGIAFAMAHETGHLLAGPPFDSVYFWLSSEERADEWAWGDGMKLAFGSQRGPSLANRGLSELLALSGRSDTDRTRRVALLRDRRGV